MTTTTQIPQDRPTGGHPLPLAARRALAEIDAQFEMAVSAAKENWRRTIIDGEQFARCMEHASIRRDRHMQRWSDVNDWDTHKPVFDPATPASEVERQRVSLEQMIRSQPRISEATRQRLLDVLAAEIAAHAEAQR